METEQLELEKTILQLYLTLVQYYFGLMSKNIQPFETK